MPSIPHHSLLNIGEEELWLIDSCRVSHIWQDYLQTSIDTAQQLLAWISTVAGWLTVVCTAHDPRAIIRFAVHCSAPIIGDPRKPYAFNQEVFGCETQTKKHSKLMLKKCKRCRSSARNTSRNVGEDEPLSGALKAPPWASSDRPQGSMPS